MTNDLIIVGGGPAGLATAIFAARAGLSSILLDKRSLPLDKPCGEGIMPPGVALLREMGVHVPHSPFHGIHYVDGDILAEGRFQRKPGWGVRRTALVRGMVERAEELGVDLRYHTGVEGWRYKGERAVVETERGAIEARFLIGADGLHSKIRKQAGLEKSRRGAKRFGVRCHFRARPWSSFVEVHWVDGTEAYVTPVGSEEVGVALLSSGEPAGFEDMLNKFPSFRERLDGAPVVSEAKGAGPFRQRVRRRYRDNLALVGDAAGYLDAITGEGLSLAFHCARSLAETVAEGRRLASYEKEYRRLSRTYSWMTGLLLTVARQPWLRRRVIATLARKPELFDRLLAISLGEQPVRTMGLGGVVRLLEGLAVSPSRVPSTTFRSGSSV